MACSSVGFHMVSSKRASGAVDNHRIEDEEDEEEDEGVVVEG